VRPSTSLTTEEEARAAELEARIVAEERAADQALRRSRERARGSAASPGRELSPLSVRASEEYAYVRRDVIRIVRVGGSLLGILAILYGLVNVFRVVSI